MSDVSAKLHTFFVPQMEQLALAERPSTAGSLSTLSAEWGRGLLWACSVGDHCLFTFHDLQVDQPRQLVEFPEDYLCITSMSEFSARLCPVDAPLLRARNTLSFRQKGGSVKFELQPGEHHRSFTLCLTPGFFDGLEGVSDADKEALVDYLSAGSANTHPREMARALESLVPAWATRPGAALFCESKVKEVLAHALGAAVQAANDPRDAADDRRLAREAQAIIDSRFAENLTLHSLAEELYAGRTRLCAVFKEQVGCSVGEYVRARRMAEAKRLLETTDMLAAEVSRAVGYSHQSSFTDAFRRTTGCAPSAWRAAR